MDKVYENLKIPAYSNFEEMIDSAKPDLIFFLNYWKIISPEYISKVEKGIINIHHSYRLRFLGRYSTSWAIIHARKDNNWWHGTTLHYVDSKLDNRAIIYSKRCEIKETDTSETLFNKVENLALEMFKSNFQNILIGMNKFIEPDGEFYYYGKDGNKKLCIGDNLSFEENYDFVRAGSFKDRPRPYISKTTNKIYMSIS